EGVQLIDHDVDRVFQLKDLAPDFDGDLARQIAFLDRSRDFGDVAHLRGEVGRQLVDVVGQVLPGTRCSGHVSLAAQPSFSADLAGDAGHLGGEGIQLVDHHVDGVLELQNLALNLDGDLFR